MRSPAKYAMILVVNYITHFCSFKHIEEKTGPPR